MKKPAPRTQVRFNSNRFIHLLKLFVLQYDRPNFGKHWERRAEALRLIDSIPANRCFVALSQKDFKRLMKFLRTAIALASTETGRFNPKNPLKLDFSRWWAFTGLLEGLLPSCYRRKKAPKKEA